MNEQNPQQTFWNQRFEKENYLFGTEPNDFLKSHASLFLPGQKVLAVADGEGRNGVFLATLGTDVHSVDFSDVALEKAERLAAEKGTKIKTEQVDLLAHEFSAETYDVIVAIFIQFASPVQRGGLFENLKNALVPGGLFVLQGYRPEQLDYGTGGPPERDNMYTEHFLRQTFSDFNIEHLQCHDDSIDEGPGHSGMSALIDLLARKPG